MRKFFPFRNFKINFTNFLNHFKRKENPAIEEAISKAEKLATENKYLEALLEMNKVSARKNEKFEQVQNEIRKKYNEVILVDRYNYYKKFLDASEHNAKLLKNSIITFILFALSFGIYFGSHFMKDIKDFFKFESEELEKKQKKYETASAPRLFSPFRAQQGRKFTFAKSLSDRLSDVKGVDEVREEIEEIVKMLKNPEKYEEAGAKLIRGILLIGKPGTGKTLLARALAGESGVNFIYISASEFDKGLVGAGNKVLKDLFEQARKNKPCIIFIDEIDTLLHSGRRQGKYSSSFDRSLINTFLAEMDGFKQRDHIFVMGATNSDKDLDKAALRPGRFDKIVHVPLPDKKGRREIFDLYLGRIKLPCKDISSDLLSKMTPGFTGAEIENMVNTAIISAVDVDKEFLSKEDFEDARDRVVLGIRRRIKGRAANIRSLLQTAIHEAGHTLVCYKDKICNKGIHKVTIIPRGESKGKTSTLLDEMEGTKEEFISMIDMSLAGRIAEELYFGPEKVGIGCGNDLSRATALAKSMVKRYAMDTKFGYMVVEEEDYIVSHRISADTRNVLDLSVANILQQRSSIVKEALKNNITDLKSLAQKLVEYEELNRNDIDNILSGKEVEDKTDKKEKKRTITMEGIAL